jgi:hypothetical protein
MADQFDELALTICREAEATGRMHAGFLWHKIASALRAAVEAERAACAEAAMAEAVNPTFDGEDYCQGWAEACGHVSAILEMRGNDGAGDNGVIGASHGG